MKVVWLLSFLSAALATSEDWANFKLQHGKSYEDLNEEKFRMEVYQRNKEMIDEHNRRYELGLETYNLEMNKFGDLTEEEFAAEYLSAQVTPVISPADNDSAYIPPASPIPLSVDWRTKGAVTDVKNQGKCGACYAFSAVGALETQIFLKTGQLTSLSAQQLVDCSLTYKYKNHACKGGLTDNSYNYIKDVGIASEKDYPYEGNDDWRRGCKYSKQGMKSSGKCRGFVRLPAGDEAKLAHALASVGTVTVSIQGRKSNLAFYKSGVHFSPRCDNKFLDHIMLAVGYGTTETGEDYWIVKNSWGPEWGEGGYVRMARNRENNCGIAIWPTYPLV